MAHKRRKLTPEQQAAEFQRYAEEQIAAGNLDPTAAEAAVDALVRRAVKPKENKDE